jgi:type VI secretion system protein ImpM
MAPTEALPGAGHFTPGATGFLGKLPARGDFLRAGVSSSFADAMDAWCALRIGEARTAFGADWQALYLEAPIWRFLLAPGIAGPTAALGLWLPSIDKVGRHFPLILAAQAPCQEALAGGSEWLAVAAAVGSAAIAEDWEPVRVSAALAAPVPTCSPLLLPPPGESRWWTDGAPRVQPGEFCVAGLPDAARFALMLCDNKEISREGATAPGLVRHADEGVDGDA